MATNALEACIKHKQALSHFLASARTAGWMSRERTKAKNGPSNKERAIFFPIADQINPSPAKATKPVPTMAPVSA